MVNLNVRIDDSEHQKLVQACSGRGCDKSSIVREALRAYLGGANAQSGQVNSSATTNHASQNNTSTDIWHGIPRAKIRGVVE